MTKKSGKSGKSLRYLILTVLFLVSAAAAAGCGQGDSEAKQQAQAALQQLLSCTLQQAEEFNAAMRQSLIGGQNDGEVGLSQGSDELEEYLAERFSDVMTDSCVEDLAESRTFHESVALAINFNSDIEARDIKFKERSGEEEGYTFSAGLKTSDGKTIVVANGTISMEEDESGWKASKITLTIEDAGN